MMVRDHHFNFSSTLPATTNFLEVHNLLQRVSRSCPLNSIFKDPAVFSSKLCPTIVCVESNEEASAAEGGCGSASPSEEAQPSQHGEELRRRQSSGRSRGGGGSRNETKHTLYKGVRKRQGGRWVSEIREPGKKSRIWLGTFPTPEMAARAYDVAVFNLKRPCAYVNFPEAVSSLPVLQSRSPKHIQEAASAAAMAFGGAASSSHAGRSGGVVPTSEAAETSNLAFTSSPMPEQQQLLHPQSTSPPTRGPSFFDEDLIFNMPNVMIEMAEGLMITPPLLHHGTDYGDNNINKSNDDNDRAGSPLWDL